MFGLVEPRLTVAEILSHPRYAEARRLHVEAIVAIFDHDHFKIRLIGDSSRIMLSSLLVGYHACHDGADRRSWATLGNIQALVASWGVASPRRLADVVARFRQVGFVEATVVDSDRRMRLLQPTAKLLAHDFSYLAAFHRFLRVLNPATHPGWFEQGDGAGHIALRRAGLIYLRTAAGFVPRHPEVMSFVNQDAGYLCLMMAVHHALDGDGQRPLSFSGLARRLGVSRTHVRNVFARARDLGWIDMDRANNTFVVRPEMWLSFDPFVADIMAGHDAMASVAFPDAPPPPRLGAQRPAAPPGDPSGFVAPRGVAGGAIPDA